MPGARASALLFLATPALWPHWPFLTLVRRAGGREELGAVFDARATVFKTCLFLLPPTFEQFLALPHDTFDTAEELLDAGWAVGWRDPPGPSGESAMTVFTRAVAQSFRLLFARCVAGRPRGPAPPVVVRIRGGIRTLAATTGEGVTLTHTATAPEEPDDLLVLPATVLAEVEGGADEEVPLDREAGMRGAVRWPGGGRPRALPVELILPGRQHELPAAPALLPVPARLLAALHECGRTAAKENGRYALSKVQLQGRAGRVVGTDGKVALLCRGFDFPFSDDVLVPALPVFGARPLARVAEVKIGRSEAHLVARVGPWSMAPDRRAGEVPGRGRGRPAIRADDGGDRRVRRGGAAVGPARSARRGARTASGHPRHRRRRSRPGTDRRR